LIAPVLRQWWGKPGLILLSGICLPLLGFATIAWRVWGLTGGFVWDVTILEAIHCMARPALTQFAVVFTQFGSAWRLLPMIVAIAGLFAFRKQWRSLLYVVVMLLGSAAINLYAKTFWHRMRPHLWDSSFPPLTDFSFPSGHAMSSLVAAAILITLCWHTRWRWLVLAIGIAYVVGIGWSRLYLGVHYPSDILAGWMIAIAWAISMNLLINPLANHAASPLEPPT
jgi:membrane-associated phospholipid phosphatase